MLRIYALEIDDDILDKIETRHRVPFDLVEEACYSPLRHIRRGRDGLYKVFGRAEAGRYLFVVLADSGAGVWRVVTARDMTDSERTLYRRERVRGIR